MEWPKFTFRDFSLCRTWLLEWCLECAEVTTSPQFLKIYTGYLLVSEQSSRRPWWSGSVFIVSLQPISATSAYPLLPSQVVSICDLQRLALYWFHAPGLQLDNEVSQSTDQPHGTVCHQHYGHRTCRRAPSSGHWRRTCSRPPGAIESLHDFGAEYKYPDLLTYLPLIVVVAHKSCIVTGNPKSGIPNI